MAARIATLLLALALLVLTACGENAPAPSRSASPTVSPAPSPTPQVSAPSPTATPFPLFEIPEPSFAYATFDGTIWLASANGSARRQLLPKVGQIASDASRNVVWSPDGRFLSYVAGEGQLTLLEVDTGRQIVLDDGSDGLVHSGSHWAPDGQHIAYNKISSDPRIPGPLFIAALDGSHWPFLEAGGGPYVAWSPDGSRIAYAGAPSPGTDFSSGPRGAALWVVNVDGSNPRHLTEYASGSSWSPDGRLLAYWKNEHGGSAFVGDICVIDVITAKEICLGGFTSDEGGGWAPDPKQYIYHNLRIDPGSGTFSELFDRPGVLLSWSPDSNKVAYVEGAPFSEGARSLVILNLADYQATRLHTTNVRTGHTPPYLGNWSSDSRYFAFTALESEQYDSALYVLDAVSGSITLALEPYFGYLYALYSPDSSRLLIQYPTFGARAAVLTANADGSGVLKAAEGEAVGWRPAPK